MIMLVPLDGDDTQTSVVSSIDGRKTMASIELEPNGEIIEINFINDIEAALAQGVDYLIIDDASQELDTYFDYEVNVLQCMPQSTIDDIMEGFMFRTLQEVV